MVFNGYPRDLNSKEASQQNTAHGLPTSKVVAALLMVIFCVTCYSFKSNTLIGDGLRHLPALRTITQGATATYQSKPWLEIYRNYYDGLVVHNHFLFGVTMRAAFALQQKLGIPGDALVAMHAVNALSAAVAGGLFFLLALRVGVPIWISLAVTLGLCLSPAYLLAATNVAEDSNRPRGGSIRMVGDAPERSGRATLDCETVAMRTSRSFRERDEPPSRVPKKGDEETAMMAEQEKKGNAAAFER